MGRPRRGSRDQGQLPVRDGEAAESNGRTGCWAGGPRGRGSMRGPGHTREDVPWGRLAIGEGRRRETRPGNRRGQGKVTPSGEPLQAECLRLGWLAAPRLYWGRGFSVGCGL